MTGGWSIGIEAVLYVLFTMALIRRPSLRFLIPLGVALLVLRVAWIAEFVPHGSLVAHWVAYTQVPAFLVFFCAGVIGAELREVGWLRRDRGLPTALIPLFGFVVLGLTLSLTGEQLIRGWLGVSLTVGCIAAVLVVSTSRLNVASSAGRAGVLLGDASYGIYLLHPLVFIASNKLLSDYTPLHWRLAPVVVTLAVTPVVAFMVNRHMERPLGLRIKRMRYGRASVV